MAIVNIGDPIIAEHQGWFATWHGGEYIEMWRSREDAETDARGEGVDGGGVDVLNTTGDDPGATREEWEAYVRDELAAWVRTDAQYY